MGRQRDREGPRPAQVEHGRARDLDGEHRPAPPDRAPPVPAGLAFLSLSRTVVGSALFASEWREFVLPLARQLQDTVNLAVFETGRVVYVDKLEGELTAVLERRGLPAFTRRTITNVRRLREELARVTEQGYAMASEEAIEGLCCVAAPVRDFEGDVVAAMSVSVAARKFYPRSDEYCRLVVQVAETFSQRLGYFPGAGDVPPTAPHPPGRSPWSGGGPCSPFEGLLRSGKPLVAPAA